MCVGNITTADQVNTILAAGRADLVALGRPHWRIRASPSTPRAEYGRRGVLPARISGGKDQAFRNKRGRGELNELREGAPQHAFPEIKAGRRRPVADGAGRNLYGREAGRESRDQHWALDQH
jgi:anthraniloyl-CoA monooxygenase